MIPQGLRRILYVPFFQRLASDLKCITEEAEVVK